MSFLDEVPWNGEGLIAATLRDNPARFYGLPPGASEAGAGDAPPAATVRMASP